MIRNFATLCEGVDDCYLLRLSHFVKFSHLSETFGFLETLNVADH